MSNFTERHHAFISAIFYKIMKEENYSNFRTAFKMAVQRYAQQRGGRMAQRAIRDNRPLDFSSYRYYGEWVPTPQSLAENPNPETSAERTEEGKDLKTKINFCPWSLQYLDMSLLDGADDYCEVLDVNLARGFNPNLVFEVPKTMHANRDHCIQYQRDAKFGNEQAYGPKDPNNQKSFEYHCAHVYKTFSELMIAIYKQKGLTLNAKVLEAFAASYGQQMADKLLEYRNYDFNYID